MSDIIDLFEKLRISKPDDRYSVLRNSLDKMFRKLLGVDKDTELDYDETFNNFGMDSVSAVQFTKKINDSFEGYFEIESTDVFDYPTFNKFTDYMASKIQLEGLCKDFAPEGSKEEEEGKSAEDVFKELDS